MLMVIFLPGMDARKALCAIIAHNAQICYMIVMECLALKQGTRYILLNFNLVKVVNTYGHCIIFCGDYYANTLIDNTEII